MASDKKFCEECGSPLPAGAHFCEECGGRITQPAEPEPAVSPSVPQVSPPGVLPATPIAVIPFVYQQSGWFSIDYLTLVLYPESLVIVYVPKSRMKDRDQSSIEIQAALMGKHLEGKKLWDVAAGIGTALVKIAWSAPDYYTTDAAKEQDMLRTVVIKTRYWEGYLSMTLDEVVAEDPRNKVIPRELIGYIRGESDLSTNTEQILIGSSGGLVTLYFEFGIFHLARKALFSFFLPETGLPEQVLGIIPCGSEPEVEGFGFQYTWIAVVTDKRVCFCMIEEDMSDKLGPWLKQQKKQAKDSGHSLWGGDEMQSRDAPWQGLINKTPLELLKKEVNFFIPHSRIRSVEIITGGPGRADEICFSLPGEPYCLTFPEGTAAHAHSVLGKVVAVRNA